MAGEWQRLADYIKDAMAEEGLSSQQELADAAGVGSRMVYDLLTGRDRDRMPRKIARVERALSWRPGTARRIIAGEDPLGADGDGRMTHDEQVDQVIDGLRKLPARERMRILARLMNEMGDDLDDGESR